MRLIAGLGNPGDRYRDSRHNAGFVVLERWAQRQGLRFKRVFDVEMLEHRGCLLVKPLLYMNRSGQAIKGLYKSRNIEQLLVVVDDIALPYGTLRLRARGGDAGHNGLAHINIILGTSGYARLRFGIGDDFHQGGQVNYVLGGWTEQQEKTLPERIRMAGEIITSFGVIGLQRTMNMYNNK